MLGRLSASAADVRPPFDPKHSNTCYGLAFTLAFYAVMAVHTAAAAGDPVAPVRRRYSSAQCSAEALFAADGGMDDKDEFWLLHAFACVFEAWPRLALFRVLQ